VQQDVFLSLKKIEFLASQSDEALLALAEKGSSKSFPKQTIIFWEGDESNSLYILLEGKVVFFTTNDHGRETKLRNSAVSGSYFGELALLGDMPRTASVKAIEKTVCAVISKHDFKQWLDAHPDAVYGLLADLSLRVRDLTQKVTQMIGANVYERLRFVLLDMATEENGILTIRNVPTQQELADTVGASRRMISNILKQLKSGVYIAIRGKTMTIRNLPESW
jgi:CRP/FNR family cyclic AMP-dependent transcriptional regulator